MFHTQDAQKAARLLLKTLCVKIQIKTTIKNNKEIIMSAETLAWIIPALLGYIIYQLDFIVKRLADIQILGTQIRDKKD